jgi:hypothetical protein
MRAQTLISHLDGFFESPSGHLLPKRVKSTPSEPNKHQNLFSARRKQSCKHIPMSRGKDSIYRLKSAKCEVLIAN